MVEMSVAHPKHVRDQRLSTISDLFQIECQGFQHSGDRLEFGNVDAGDGPVKGAAKRCLILTRTASSRPRCSIGVGGAGGLDLAQAALALTSILDADDR